jgi:hypothetical protein
MIWIVHDPDSGEYELLEFRDEDGTTCVIDPTSVEWQGVDWGTVKPDWIQDHGTVIVLLGSDAYPDTVLGNPDAGETDIKGLSVYLNTRFWDLSTSSVKVVEVRSDKKSRWPQGPNDRDDARRPNNRTIMGARHYLTNVTGGKGSLKASGTQLLDSDRVSVDWYLWAGDRPAIHSYAKKGGYVAVRYNDELFELTSSKVQFRSFGIVESQVQQNLTLILEPQHYRVTNGAWGVHPDQSRNRLIFTGGGEKGVQLPMSDWGLEFAEDMPATILDAIRAARGDLSGSIEDEEYRKRLQDKFGDRWTLKRMVAASSGDDDAAPAATIDEEVEIPAAPDPKKPRSRRKRKKTVRIIRKKAVPGEGDSAVERDVPVDVPGYRYGHRDEFEQPWHLALWAPNDPTGPTVVLNIDSPILEEVIKYHQDRCLSVYAEKVAETVQQVFGEVAACKIAHSQKLVKELPEEELDRLYRSEEALTFGLMGLMAEESLIAYRLKKLGRKKVVA